MESTSRVPEFREMVAAAEQFVAGELHFSFLVSPIERCVDWAKVHDRNSQVYKLATEWQLLVDRTWNEFGQHED